MKTLAMVAALMLGALGWNSVFTQPKSAVGGQDVYIAEGCIHCHSQFVRLESLDTNIYGPASLTEERPGKAVLIGNRRQGPDLSAVGLRRSRAWNREHLIDPQAVSPGSRMPSYRHLFEGAGERGEALLDYLSGFGREKALDWYQRVSEWKPGMQGGAVERGAELFQQLCQHCHGEHGEGNGVLADRFSPAPTDFAAGIFRFAPIAMPEEVRRARLANIVKYGISGTSMPGHEYLTDQDIADLVTFVSEFSLRTESEK